MGVCWIFLSRKRSLLIAPKTKSDTRSLSKRSRCENAHFDVSDNRDRWCALLPRDKTADVSLTQERGP